MAERMRRIVVEGQPFRCRFDDELIVILGHFSSPQMYVDWGGRDWLEPEGPGPEPLVVTPRFVAAAVRFALAHGWRPSAEGRSLRLGFQDGSFTLTAKSAEAGADEKVGD